MKGGDCVELAVAVAEAGVVARLEELWLGWEGASMTAVVWEQEDEEVGLREKEMRDEASFPPGWVEDLRLKGSARLSEKRKKIAISK